MNANSENPSRGFTLIEVVITLLLLGVLSAFIARPLISLIQARADVSDAAAQHSEIEHALSRMARDIRLSDDSTEISGCGEGVLTLNRDGDERVYERNENGTLMLDDNVIASDVRIFECEALEPADLRLYELILNNSEVRAFKRDG
ncbi:PulJ/GspJ family protein [Spiribacter aquaticus]|nr:type II secretion system protein [Spiribacter aquaticus]